MAEKGGVLTALDLDHVANDILTAQKLNDYFKKVERSVYPLLSEKADKLFDISPLEQEIHRIISPSLSIYDNASPTLHKIRKEISRLEAEVRSSARPFISRYKEYLSEETISIRNDHFVLPVNSNYKYKVPGIVHDVSDSGSTTFIEPSELVELSNRICIHKLEEKEEINRLLRMLSEKVVESAPEV